MYGVCFQYLVSDWHFRMSLIEVFWLNVTQKDFFANLQGKLRICSQILSETNAKQAHMTWWLTLLNQMCPCPEAAEPAKIITTSLHSSFELILLDCPDGFASDLGLSIKAAHVHFGLIIGNRRVKEVFEETRMLLHSLMRKTQRTDPTWRGVSGGKKRKEEAIRLLKKNYFLHWKELNIYVAFPRAPERKMANSPQVLWFV